MHQPLLEKKELFTSIRSYGLQIDDSLLQEFQEQGVMLPAQRRGRGRGKGNRGLWTLRQRDLLRTLCLMRERHNIRSIAQRCNLIVWIWLYWGDEWGITLEQVQHVMKTWATYQQSSSLKMAKQGAKRVVNEVANHNSGGKQQAIREISKMFYDGIYTSQGLSDSLYHVFDSKKTANGPHDIPVTPEVMSWGITLRQEAVNRIVHEPAIHDVQWMWARHFHLVGVGQYVLQQRAYAQEAVGSPVEHLFTVDSIETVLSTACIDLAMVLGIGERSPNAPTLPDHLRLEFWQRHVQKATVVSKQVISPFVLPDGSRPQSLHIDETLTLFTVDEHRKEGR